MDRWDGGSDYDVFMGRWSRLTAGEFVGSLGKPGGLRWLDVGCGTGALLEALVHHARPSAAFGVDPSEDFAAAARSRLNGNAEVRVAHGERLPFGDAEFDVVVSGLVLNFIPDPLAALAEWRRVTRSGGSIAAYVWDYAEGMEFLRYFWDAAASLDPRARELDEGMRFPICRPEPLRRLFEDAGFSAVLGGAIEAPTAFSDFDDFWTPFLLGQGPAPSYVAGLETEQRRQLKETLRESVPRAPDGSVNLTARAWTISGIN